MKTGSVFLGKKSIENNLFLAPMAGFTDYPFRKTIVPLGVGLSFTELTSAKGLYYGGKNNAVLLMADDKNKTAAQIFGNDPYYMRWACESDYLRDFDVVDINMGCPVPKIVKNGDGSALLENIRSAEAVIKECVKSGKIITVKLRTGIKQGEDIAAEFCKMAQDAGASLVTVHGRVREAYYSGEPDYRAIERAKRAVSIPVIANGGIFTVEDADKMMQNTGADGVMIARGAIADPFIFLKIQNKVADGGIKTVKDFVLAHFDEEVALFGEKRASVEFRKFVTYYFKSVSDSKAKRMKIMAEDNAEEIKRLLREYL